MACSGFAGLGAAPEMGLPETRNGLSLSRCRIVAPEDRDVRKAVRDIADLIARNGGQAAVASPSNAMDSSGLRLAVSEGEPETLTLAGSIASNRAMLPLYAMFLDFTDAYHPGGDGCAIRALPDAPVRGTGAIILGGQLRGRDGQSDPPYLRDPGRPETGRPFPPDTGGRTGRGSPFPAQRYGCLPGRRFCGLSLRPDRGGTLR
ncbi:MAG: hypothetical protein IT210_06655 [Armatimonadetes bacterium]|nr:hypothetical protein [Armatimonadota bacterium]